jgi:hypothetical protein
MERAIGSSSSTVDSWGNDVTTLRYLTVMYLGTPLQVSEENLSDLTISPMSLQQIFSAQ